MTRAVINLAGDISDAMPTIAKTVEGAAYNKEIPILAFRYNNCRVMIKPKEITIKDLQKKDEANEVIEYLKNIFVKN